MHRPGQRRRAPQDRARLLRLPGRQDRSAGPRHGTADERGRRAARLRAGRAAARQHLGAQAGAGEAGGGVRGRHRRRRGRLRRRRAGGRGAGVPRPRRPGARSARLDRREVRGAGESGQEHLVEQFLTQFYGEQAELDGAADEYDQPGAAPGAGSGAARPTPASWTSGCRGLRGSRVALRVPQRGDKKALAETVKRNAADALAQHKLKRAGDFTARSAALQSIQDASGLADAPLRIECVDISHVQGTDVVASLVVFEDGLPRKSDYRHFAIREAAGEGRSDDVASIAEVTRRRFLRHVAEAQTPMTLTAEGKTAQVRLSAKPFRGRRWRTAGERRADGPGRARHHRRRGDRPGQAAGGGVGAVGARPGDHAAQQRGSVPAAAGARRGAPVRDQLPPQQAVEADDGLGAGLGARAWGSTGARRWSPTSGRWPGCKQATVEEITAVPGIGVATARAVLEALGAGAPDSAGTDAAAAAMRR